MSILCRACHTEMDPSWTSCPICMRGRSRNEIMHGYAMIKKEQLWRRRRPWIIAGSLAGAALLAGLGWNYKAQIIRTTGPLASAALEKAEAPIKRFNDSLEKIENGDSQNNGVARHVQVLGSPINPNAISQPPMVQTAPPPAPSALARWIISGSVCDLSSLGSLANTKLSFASPSGDVISAHTDGHGRYRISLPLLKEGGYALNVKRRGYSGKYIEEGYVPFAQLNRRQRLDQAQGKILHVPVTVDDSGQLTFNIALIPASRQK